MAEQGWPEATDDPPLRHYRIIVEDKATGLGVVLAVTVEAADIAEGLVKAALVSMGSVADGR